MKTLYFDCFAGISGDMTLGALLDLGLNIEDLRGELSKIALSGYELSMNRVVRSQISAVKFTVSASQGDHHRSLTSIKNLINNSSLSDQVKSRATAIFQRLGEVEAKIHNIDIDRVHFHEVGAVDSIIDIVGACVGFEKLGVERFICSPLHIGRGFVESAHGRFPVPAPAAIELLKGAPIYSTDIEGELVTPTGAAIVSHLCAEFIPMPTMKVEKVGYGAGGRDYKGFPNVLRLILGDIEGVAEEEREHAGHGPVVVIETNIDDMNPQVFGYLMDRALEEGALDVFYTPVQMKKNRPGTLLTVLCERHQFDKIVELIFKETTTIGVRYYEIERRTLERYSMPVQTEFGQINIKVASLNGRIVNYAPEYVDCERAARQSGISLREVQEKARAAFNEQVNGD